MTFHKRQPSVSALHTLCRSITPVTLKLVLCGCVRAVL